MNLRIIKAGVFDTVQDLGRYGWQHLGINTGGAMDKVATQVANILVGNDSNEAVIELHFPASSFFFEQPALIAISGADFSASINGEEIPSQHPVIVSKYSILQFHNIKKGVRAYLAIHGGFNIETWLNSYSTNSKAMAGGYKGKALQKDDEIKLKTQPDLSAYIDQQEYLVLPWKAASPGETDTINEMAVLTGHEWNRLTTIAKEKFCEQSFQVTPQSDRMGYQLKGETLLVNTDEEIISTGVNFGTIQLLPDGQLIILMADHQTTGGYPRIAHVITAHHSKLAQVKPGERISFRLTDLKSAEELLIKQHQHLLQLQHACNFRMQQFLKT